MYNDNDNNVSQWIKSHDKLDKQFDAHKCTKIHDSKSTYYIVDGENYNDNDISEIIYSKIYDFTLIQLETNIQTEFVNYDDFMKCCAECILFYDNDVFVNKHYLFNLHYKYDNIKTLFDDKYFIILHKDKYSENTLYLAVEKYNTERIEIFRNSMRLIEIENMMKIMQKKLDNLFVHIQQK
ncbi:hypothetical protein BMW23_0201 [Bodo saltans virus]|uniref:Uncharacterized protein n=1 Tax=Bodo saltans virus TaxID=2024608 RepID=A0A2H4UTU4_9VIRU|nr:hypothetical protein QJ851_gp0196 [Bodo saltans virus]ATZ80259.1 hypothetical protein BMW23_0201 [Bodo saltans virus]